MIIELDSILFHILCTFAVRWSQYYVDITVTIETLLNKLASNLQIIMDSERYYFCVLVESNCGFRDFLLH